MQTYDSQATLRIHFKAEGNTPEEALAAAVEAKDYEVLSSTLEETLPDGYISIRVLAERLGYKNQRYIHDRCKQGLVPGAIRIGNQWFLPEDCDYFNTDRRMTSGGKYAGWRKKYGKKAEPEEQKEE